MKHILHLKRNHVRFYDSMFSAHRAATTTTARIAKALKISAREKNGKRQVFAQQISDVKKSKAALARHHETFN